MAANPILALAVSAGLAVRTIVYAREKRFKGVAFATIAGFLGSLLGLPVIFCVLQATGQLHLDLSVTGPLDLGGALAVGAMLGVLYAALIVAGTASYLLASLYASFRRRQRPPGIKS